MVTRRVLAHPFMAFMQWVSENVWQFLISKCTIKQRLEKSHSVWESWLPWQSCESTYLFFTWFSVDAHLQRTFPRDGDRSGNVYQPYTTPTHISGYQPHARREDSALHIPHAQSQSTASVAGEQHTSVRLPKQPPKAAAVATAASNTHQSKQPNPWKGQ